MAVVRNTALLALAMGAACFHAENADAQVLRRIRERAEQRVEQRILRATDRIVDCLIGDLDCVARAEEEGTAVRVVDERGNVVSVSDPPQARPGQGVWANYDFVPGERVLLYEDFMQDNIGDFPRRFELVRGNWDVVEVDGQPLLRNTGPRHSAVRVPLPERLPEKFTIELAVLVYEGNANLALSISPPPTGPEHRYRVHHYEHNYFDIGSWGVGVTSRDPAHPKASQRVGDALTTALVPIRIMADGGHVKMYVGERRVANVPNAVLDRSETLWIENTYDASEDKPILIGPIRVAAGGRDLYDALAAEGRAVTRGILFDVGSSRLRPESTPTLTEIGTMLQHHPDLRLRIEGHTDSVGDETSNQRLSELRAGAVREHLMTEFQIEGGRLESVGFGESRPVDSNETPEGRQTNRRVELVRL